MFKIAFLFLLGLTTQLAATPPAPIQDHCPVVIVNKTGLPANEVFFVSNGLDTAGTPCFLVPNESGICKCVYPQPDGSISSANSSRTLDQLPLATGTSIQGDTYLCYLPANTSTRAYFSIKAPMYLSTTPSPSIGKLAINSPSVISLSDPNYYTLYQDFEFSFITNQDLSHNLYLNLSWVDYFCLPMQLYANNYPDNTPIHSAICAPSGFPSDSVRDEIGRAHV